MKTTEPAEGEFWLPQVPDERVPGTLFLSEAAGPRLKLARLLTKSDTEPNPIPVIFGSTFGLGHVTLADCFRSEESSAAFLNVSRQTFLPSLVFTGIHTSEPLKLQIQGATARYTYLEQWTTPPKVKWTRSDDPDPSAAFQVRVEITGTSPAVAQLPAHTVRFVHGHSERGSSSRIEIGFEARVVWQLNAPTTLDPLIVEQLFPFRDLFSLALGQTAELVELEIFPAPSGVPPPKDGFPPVLNAGVFLLEMRHGRRADPAKRIQFLFRLGELAPTLSTALASWHRLYAEQRQALVNFFSVAYRHEMYAEARFLSLAQALESYCRSRFPSETALPPAEYQELRERITNEFSKHADWIDHRLRNDPTLRQRLKLLLQQSPIQVALLGSTPTKLISRIVDVRNALSHGSKDSLKPPLGDFELLDLDDGMITLIEALLLEHLGFERGAILERLSNSARDRDRAVTIMEGSKQKDGWEAPQ